MQRAWLLTFSSPGPDVTLDHLRMVGGFRLDECYATVGVRHKFVLLGISSDIKDSIELRCIERFMLRMQREYGVSPSAMPDSCAIVSDVGRRGGGIWLHPGFRVMVDRVKHLDSSLRAWTNGVGISKGLLHKHGDISDTKTCNKDQIIREAVLLNRSANYRRNGSTMVQRFYRANAETYVKQEQDEDVAPQVVGRRRQRAEEMDDKYQYVKRKNDDKWVMGWV
jgi:hypothetical protein